jgi:hypothetical protein
VFFAYYLLYGISSSIYYIHLSIDYWSRLIFTIVEQDIIDYNGVSLISLDLHNFKSISEPKNALLDVLSIDYSVNKIELLEIVRVGNYGMSCEEKWDQVQSFKAFIYVYKTIFF